MKKTFCLLPLAAALVLAGCNLAPDYVRPEAPVASEWPQDAAIRNAALLTEGLAKWSEFFTDERLQKLIGMGLENNRSLRASIFNVEQARAQYNVSRADLLPSVAATAEESAATTPGQLTSSGRRVTSHQYTVAAMASYEIDFFGRIRNLNEQALQAYLATEAAQRSAQMTLIADIATTWLSLGAQKQLLKLAEDTLASQQESYRLIKSSYDLGASSLLDVHQAEQTVASAKQARAQATRLASQYRNALRLLVGGDVPSDLEPPGLELKVTKPSSALSNVPSEVLLARPDIAQAEAQLRSANANIGVARAAFFPSVSLTGGYGTASASFSALFDSGTRMWTWVPSLNLPIFAGGANVANLRAAEAAQKAAVANYEYAIQAAFSEVADALATEGTIGDEVKAREEFAHATQESFKLAQDRYSNGADSYLSVLDSQRENFAAQQNLISARLSRVVSLVTLYRVMGGGSALEDSADQTRVQIEQGGGLKGAWKPARAAGQDK